MKFNIREIIVLGLIVLLIVCTSSAADGILKTRVCYSCRGINCLRPSQQNVTTVCPDELDVCLTIFDEQTIIAKGCYLDMPENLRSKCEVPDKRECLSCFNNLCNKNGRDDNACIKCDSINNKNCAGNAIELQPVQCESPTALNSYCYVRAVGNGVIERGCLVHSKDQIACKNDQSCRMCLTADSPGCNSFKYEVLSSSSAAVKGYSFLLVAIFILKKLF